MLIWAAILAVWNQDAVRSAADIAISSVSTVATSSLPRIYVDNNQQNLQVSADTIAAIMSAPAPVTHDLIWTIAHDTLSPDGVIREMTLINKLFPGPIVRARKGDRMRIRVKNNLEQFDENTSLHFHGLYQRGTNVMDGVPGVTQCGIQPNTEDFVYEFDLTQSGTFWWHSHSHLQRVDGAFGGLIVYDQEDHYQIRRDYDEEIFIILHDHHHATGMAMYDWYLSKDSAGYEVSFISVDSLYYFSY